MPLTLATRIGPDTLGKLEQAARRRYAEARRLTADEPLGAIYLFGYTIEMRLKAAYYRVVGLGTAHHISAGAPSPRKVAETKICALLLLKPNSPVGHNLYGWGKLLEQTRATLPAPGPLPTPMLSDMYIHLQNASLCWTEVIRYRATPPYDEELQVVDAAARWFRMNYRRLWS